MNLNVRIIDVKAAVFADNDERAGALRASLRERGILLVNVMGSPGAGKTSLLAALLPLLGKGIRPAVIEADLDSRVDADALERLGWKAVQLRTGGFCHLDAYMVERGLEELGLLEAQVPATGIIVPCYNLVFVDRAGCTGQRDTDQLPELVVARRMCGHHSWGEHDNMIT
jgi:hydrogenase nickel incorporation protein HypB